MHDFIRPIKKMISLNMLCFVVSTMNMGDAEHSVLCGISGWEDRNPWVLPQWCCLTLRQGNKHQLASLALSYPSVSKVAFMQAILQIWGFKFHFSNNDVREVGFRCCVMRLRGERRCRLLLNKCPAFTIGIDASLFRLSPVTSHC